MTDPEPGTPPRSPVHELARMSQLDLITLYNRMATAAGVAPVVQLSVTAAGTDTIIAAIRSLEDAAP